MSYKNFKVNNRRLNLKVFRLYADGIYFAKPIVIILLEK